jgi:hypothetical protein
VHLYSASYNSWQKEKVSGANLQCDCQNEQHQNRAAKAMVALSRKGKRARRKRENCAKAGKTFQSALFQLAWLKQKIIPAKLYLNLKSLLPANQKRLTE